MNEKKLKSKDLMKLLSKPEKDEREYLPDEVLDDLKEEEIDIAWNKEEKDGEWKIYY